MSRRVFEISVMLLITIKPPLLLSLTLSLLAQQLMTAGLW